MKQPLARSSVLFLLCCLAFAMAYVATRAASGQAMLADPATTPGPSATLTPDSTSAPTSDATATPGGASSTPATETPVPNGAPPSFDELGDPAAAGSVFQKYGVRLVIPEGLGDFRVMYPVIVDWGLPQDDQHPGVIMTVYNPQTKSSLFLRFEDGAQGRRVVEFGRHIGQAEANAALDSIASTMELAR